MVRIFSALAQAYDLVVLYGDTESASRFQASLQGRLAMVIAVLAGAGDPTAAMTAIAELTSFGAPVFPYDKSAADDRSGDFRPHRCTLSRYCLGFRANSVCRARSAMGQIGPNHVPNPGAGPALRSGRLASRAKLEIPPTEARLDISSVS